MQDETCPKCGSNDSRKIVYGLPGPELVEDADRGEVTLGGCVISDESPAWECRSCGKRYGRLTYGEEL